MKQLLLAATIVVAGCGVALAQNGSVASDNAAPMAQTQSNDMTTANVRMHKRWWRRHHRHHRRHHMMTNKGNAPGPQTGTATDKASAPAR